MPEPITVVGAGAIGAYLGKDGLAKLLGPTADYLGGELQAYTQRRMENVGRIFSKAESKLGDKLDQPGQVPPKVLKTIINEGSYADDELAAEYFGGVLASSRTEIGRDDRGARIAKILDNLSSYQVRTHYLIYSSVASVFAGKGKQFGLSENRSEMEIFLPLVSYYPAMDFSPEEVRNHQIMSHIWHGLFNDGLIEKRWQYGSQESLKTLFKDCPAQGIICQPSALGAELYLWALGIGDQSVDSILSGKFALEFDGLPKAMTGVLATKT